MNLNLTHIALPYGTDEQFMSAAVPFLAEGRARDEMILAVTDERKLDLLQQAVDQRGITFIPASEFYRHPTRIVSRVLGFVEEQRRIGRRLRILAEPVWSGRSLVEQVEWQRVEAIINVAFAATGASIMCPYNLRALPVEVLEGARRTHPQSASGTLRRENPAYLDPYTFNAMCDRKPLSERPASSAALPVRSPDMHDLRALVSVHARRYGMTGGTLHNLLVAVTEVATNALTHGEPPIVLRLWHEGDQLVCEVADQGHWDPVDDPGPGLLPPELRERSGLGLWAVRMLTDIVQVRTGPAGTTVRIRAPLCA